MVGSDPVSHTKMGFYGKGLLKKSNRAGVNWLNHQNCLGLRHCTSIGLFRETWSTAESIIGIGVFLGLTVFRNMVRARMARKLGNIPLELELRGEYVDMQVLTPSPILGLGFW